VPKTADEISPLEFIQLLAEPHRWTLLRELARSDRRVGELTELLEEPQNLVSYHLAELRRAGVVSARRSSADGRDTYYRVEPQRCGELLSATSGALQPGLRLVSVPPDALSIRGKRPKVLFLCTGNSARSQMAEAFLEHLSGGRIEARSAGSHPRSLHADAVRAMAERGIDISGSRAKHLSRFAHTRFDRVITLCDKVREVCPEFPGGPTSAHWSIADPAAAQGAETYPVFQATADDIERRVRLLIAQMTADASERRAS
jgi:protein-tyrosine-phosphatase/DNA-binding HxlR family transcriptional regulator